MEERPPSPMNRFYNFLPTAELICLAGAFIGVLLKRIDQPGDDVLRISLSGLAGIFFLSAFRPPEGSQGDVPKGFMDLLFATILPKIMGISLAVSVIGILFTLLHFPGNKEFLRIGGAVLVMALVLTGAGLATGNDRAKAIKPLLYRAMPMVLVTAYLLFF